MELIAKASRGGKRGGGDIPNASAPFTNTPNPYSIPDTLQEATGPQGDPMSMTDSFFDSNPYYSGEYAEFSQNCQRCVMAYEMRRRGYDVEALPTYQGDQMPTNMNWLGALNGAEIANVGKTTENATIKAIEKQMADWGDGSRGIIRIKWAGGNTGHVINCEMQNGKLYVFDAQNNGKATGKTLLKEYLPYATLSRTQVIRTDNATITDNMKYMVKPK